MVLCVVIMCMVYLVTETRTRVGEPGINNPNVKLWVTSFTFFVLLMLSYLGATDPTDLSAAPGSRASTTALSNSTAQAGLDFNLPLKDVCAISAYARTGYAIFFVISFACLGFVIFGTSAQSLSGLIGACGCCHCLCRRCCTGGEASGEEELGEGLSFSTVALEVTQRSWDQGARRGSQDGAAAASSTAASGASDGAAPAGATGAASAPTSPSEVAPKLQRENSALRDARIRKDKREPNARCQTSHPWAATHGCDAQPTTLL